MVVIISVAHLSGGSLEVWVQRLLQSLYLARFRCNRAVGLRLCRLLSRGQKLPQSSYSKQATARFFT
ncbi:MAG: hypothetical protein DMG96_40310 [Acidobacteria bacterium]|nr:MAG: hypothetical protein DMG96_40310 [Acidobacteriota bacterium]